MEGKNSSGQIDPHAVPPLLPARVALVAGGPPQRVAIQRRPAAARARCSPQESRHSAIGPAQHQRCLDGRRDAVLRLRQGEGLDEEGEGAARGGAHGCRDIVAVVRLRQAADARKEGRSQSDNSARKGGTSALTCRAPAEWDHMRCDPGRRRCARR